MSKILKPRRGDYASMTQGSKKYTILAPGEFFLEVNENGVGRGPCKIKIGDGERTYPNLPYALGDDVSNQTSDVTNNASTTVTAALRAVESGNTVPDILGGVKQSINLLNRKTNESYADQSFTYTEDTSTDVEDALDNAISGSPLNSIIAGFKQAINLLNISLTRTSTTLSELKATVDSKPDMNTTYRMSLTNKIISLIGSDNSKSTVDLSNFAFKSESAISGLTSVTLASGKFSVSIGKVKTVSLTKTWAGSVPQYIGLQTFGLTSVNAAYTSTINDIKYSRSGSTDTFSVKVASNAARLYIGSDHDDYYYYKYNTHLTYNFNAEPDVVIVTLVLRYAYTN